MDDENPAGGLSELTDVLGLLASDFESHPLSRSIDDCEAAGRAMRAAKAEIERRNGIGGELIAARRERDELREDAACYRWLVQNWARIITDTCYGGIDEPRVVNSIELGPMTLRSVDPKSLHRAILRAMTPNAE